jgi:hypothetical protein
MSLRAADLRFLLPAAPRTAAVVPPDPPLADSLTQAGTRVLEQATDDGALDLLVASRAERSNPLVHGASSVIVRGRPASLGRSRSGDRQMHRYLVAEASSGPTLVALDTPPVRHYVARTWSRPTAISGRARNLVLATPLGTLAANLLVASRDGGVPYPISEALPDDMLGSVSGWLMSCRAGDDFQRIIMPVFTAGQSVPAAVIKFSRQAGAPARAQAEMTILGRITELAPELARQTTRILRSGRFGGSDLIVESAATGGVLTDYLRTARRRRSQPIAEKVLAWITALGVRTAHHSDVTSAQLRTDLTARFGDAAFGARLDGLPFVLAHQDLGSWNIMMNGDDFIVVDWESALDSGLPLADACYFATDALAEICGPKDLARRPVWCAELWAGALPASSALRRWITESAASLGLSIDLVPGIATACWLQHSLSRGKREALAQSAAVGYSYLGEFGRIWAGDSRLGLDWGGFSAWPAT